jgi:hypothetical protein
MITNQDFAEALRTATNDLGLVDLLVAEDWLAAAKAIDDGLTHDGILHSRVWDRAYTADIKTLQHTTNDLGLVGLLLHGRWTEAAELIDLGV